MTSGLETEWDYSGRKGRDGRKKKICKANERKGKVKRGKDAEGNGQGGRGMPRPHMGQSKSESPIHNLGFGTPTMACTTPWATGVRSCVRYELTGMSQLNNNNRVRDISYIAANVLTVSDTVSV